MTMLDELIENVRVMAKEQAIEPAPLFRLILRTMSEEDLDRLKRENAILLGIPTAYAEVVPSKEVIEVFVRRL